MDGFQKILVIDSAMDGCNVGYYDGGADVCSVQRFEGARGQAERLVPMVQGVLDDAGVVFGDVQAIVVVNGPGTFTGIRIGLSAARAFGFALGVPIYGVSSLQALAFCYVAAGRPAGDFTVVVETRRADFYVQGFDGAGCAQGAARSVLADEVGEGCVIGDGAKRLCDARGGLALVRGFERIDPQVVGAVFCSEERREACFIHNPEPIYLRGADVSQPKNPPRKLADSES